MGLVLHNLNSDWQGAAIGFETLFEDEHLKIMLQPGDGEACLIAFTGVGHALGGVDVQRQEFSKLSNFRGNRLYLIDKQRSWGNNLDFDAISRVITPHIAGKRLLCLGNSMGGFLAILFTRFFEVSSCVAFSPQFSMHPAVVPNERRWRKYTKHLSNFKIESLDACFIDDCKYYCFFGDDPGEQMHSARFPIAENIHSYEFTGRTHNVASVLKQDGELYTLIDACFARQDIGNLMNDLTAEVRKLQ